MITQTQVVATTIPSLPNEVWYGWLARFCVWVGPTTEGALEAIFGVSSVELGLAIGRKTVIHHGRKTFANLYIALIGTTGVPKKTAIPSGYPGQSAAVRDFLSDSALKRKRNSSTLPPVLARLDLRRGCRRNQPFQDWRYHLGL